MHLLRIALVLMMIMSSAQAEIVLRDDTGATLRLPKAAARIVSLAPHATENLFAAGAGERVIGVVEYSDFPAAAKRIAKVGDHAHPDFESILALKPDLVIVWQSGNAAGIVKRLETLGLPVYQTRPDRLEDIPANIEKLGRLAGSEAISSRAGAAFRQRLAALNKQYSARPPVKVFYQTWHQPLLTVGDSQIISEVIRLCGGENIFAGLRAKAPSVSIEAVLAANPEVIVASGMGYDTPIGLEDWKKWQQMQAVARGNLFHIPADLMQRPTPRLLDGAEQLCRHLESARNKRPAR